MIIVQILGTDTQIVDYNSIIDFLVNFIGLWQLVQMFPVVAVMNSNLIYS